MWFFALWGLGVVGAIIKLAVTGGSHSVQEICLALLQYQFAVTFVLCGVFGILENLVFAKRFSERLGWANSPYQYKYGWSQVALGVLGLMTLWVSGTFWLAPLIYMYIYAISGFLTHVQLMRKNGKADADNVGNLVMTVLYQAFLTYLAIKTGVL